MTRTTSPSLVTALVIISLFGSASVSEAKPKPATQSTRIAKVRYVPPSPPPGPAPGGRHRGGARRDLCPEVNPKLSALVPYKEEPAKDANSRSTINVWGFTTQERPTLWFYSPYTASASFRAEFLLVDDTGNSVYQTEVTLPNQPTVTSVSLASMPKPLEVGKRYRWFLNVYCGVKKNAVVTSPPTYIEAMLQRVELDPDIARKIAGAPIQQKINLYAENGIWHDALTLLGEQRQKAPQDKAIQAEWQSLLEQIGFDDVATMPIAPSQ